MDFRAPRPLSTLVTLVATLWLVPRDRGRSVSLDVRGAATLTLGSTLVIAAATAIPLDGVRWIVPAALGRGGVALWCCSAGWPAEAPGRSSPAPLILESRFLRSSLAAFTQMFCLGATLVAVPLYLTGAVGISRPPTGVVVFALPASMSSLAPVAGLPDRAARSAMGDPQRPADAAPWRSRTRPATSRRPRQTWPASLRPAR